MRIGVAGLGLIGGSLALALRERHEVRGFDVARDVREAAARAGIPGVERVEALIPADAVIVATPISSMWRRYGHRWTRSHVRMRAALASWGCIRWPVRPTLVSRQRARTSF